MVRNENEGGQAEVDRHIMRRDQEYVGRQMMEMELLGKRKRGRWKRRFLNVVKEDMGKVDVREKDIENRMLWSNIICCRFLIKVKDQKEEDISLKL